MKTVYLAGPISGLGYAGATEWREGMIDLLDNQGITGLSPMRGKGYLDGETDLDATCLRYAAKHVMSSPRGIMTRDRWDATRCDVLFANLLGATKVSIGTCMEIAWADLHRVPVIAAMEPTGNPHEHAMINEAVGFRVTSLDEALKLICTMLV